MDAGRCADIFAERPTECRTQVLVIGDFATTLYMYVYVYVYVYVYMYNYYYYYIFIYPGYAQTVKNWFPLGPCMRQH